MSGTEQTWNWIGGTNYGNGTYALGSAQKYAAADNPYYDPGLSITAADFQAGILRANLNTAGSGILGTGFNSQLGDVDLTFGLLTVDEAKKPPVITRTTIGGVGVDGEFGTPAGGYIPNIASPTQPNEYGGVTTPESIPPAPAGYATDLPSSGQGSLTSPGNVEMAADGNDLVGTGLVPGIRPGRVADDDSSGDTDGSGT
jgi:hypothetical protein